MISQIPRIAFQFFPPVVLLVLAVLTIAISYMLVKYLEMNTPEGVYNAWLKVEEEPNSVAL